MRWVAVILALSPVGAAQPPKATLGTFAGEWTAHTRSFLVTRAGHATEVVDDGCCTRVLALTLQLSKPAGTTANATVSAHVTAARLYNVRTYWQNRPRPHVGQVATLRLRNGLLAEPISGAVYCNERTPPRRARLCGA